MVCVAQGRVGGQEHMDGKQWVKEGRRAVFRTEWLTGWKSNKIESLNRGLYESRTNPLTRTSQGSLGQVSDSPVLNTRPFQVQPCPGLSRVEATLSLCNTEICKTAVLLPALAPSAVRRLDTAFLSLPHLGQAEGPALSPGR